MWRASRAWIAVGVALAQLVRPRAVAGVELAGRVALHVPRQLLELDPEHALALRRAARVDRQRLPAHDRRLGRQQAALGLVDRARDAVEAGRHVHDRRPREPLVALPARRLREREVDLHLGAAVAEAAARGGDGVRRVAEQAAVELRRRDVRDHGARRADRLAVGGADADGGAVAHDDRLDLGARPARAAVVLDQPHERVGEARAAAARDRHAALLDGDRDHLRHEPGRRRVRAEARCGAPTARAGRGSAPRRTCRRASRGPRRAGCRRTRGRRAARAGGSPCRRAPCPSSTRARCRAARTRGRRSA